MKKILGISVGVLLVALSGLAFGTSSGSWAVGHDDLGFWWAVIGTLLGLAGLGAVVGTWVHTRSSRD
jgi:hypothetical protein